jgi:hypothetical protein
VSRHNRCYVCGRVKYVVGTDRDYNKMCFRSLDPANKQEDAKCYKHGYHRFRKRYEFLMGVG